MLHGELLYIQIKTALALIQPSRCWAGPTIYGGEMTYFWHKSPIPTVPGGTDRFNSQMFVLFQPSVGVRQAYPITGPCTKHELSWANEKLTPQSNIICLQHALEMEDGGHVCHHPATEVHSW